MRTALVATAALLLVSTTSSPAAACDKHAAAKSTARADCCAKKHDAAKATTAAQRESPDDYVTPALALGSEPRKAADCRMHRAAAATTATTKPAEGRKVSATGKVVCARCELKQSETCRTVFQPSGQSESIPLCNDGLSADIQKLTRHGELEVTLTGRVKQTESGDEVLCIDGFRVGTI